MACRKQWTTLLSTATRLRANVRPRSLICPSEHTAPSLPHRVANRTILPVFSVSQQRFYAAKKKGNDGGGKGKKGKKAVQEEDENEQEEDPFEFDVSELDKRMNRPIEGLKKELGSFRIGRATPALLDPVQVTHQGSRVSLQSVAQVNVKDAQTLLVIINDEELTGDIENAIRNSDLGLNPSKQDSNVIKVPIPRASKERKEALVKSVKASAEKTRTHIRGLRGDARADLKKAPKSVSADTIRSCEKEIQTVTDKRIAEIDALVNAKTKEIESS
ncbi:hypothetical protein HK104_010136 [Borealophlyctis nickersoniae]|nr:hypothetical protein HK104_010136 [Borealophlyctis nickersoniae]